jgi:hypothetical protein
MPTIDWNRVLILLPVIGLATVAPNAFPAAQLGYASLHDLALYAIMPAAALLFTLAAFGWFKGWSDITKVILPGAMAGTIATLALEAVRYPGFRLGFMPGNLPQLMGVLLLDRFAEGPSTASTVAGFAYHAWNGASFGIVFAAMARIGLVHRTPAWATAYGILIGIGFLVSPVVQSLGVGLFGVDFGWQFTATVLTAHAAFGAALSVLQRMSESCLCQIGPVSDQSYILTYNNRP